MGVEGGGGEGGGGTGRRKKEKGKDKKLSKTKRMKRSHTHKSSHSIGLCRYDTRYCYDPQDRGKGGGVRLPTTSPLPPPPSNSKQPHFSRPCFLFNFLFPRATASLAPAETVKKEGKRKMAPRCGRRGEGLGVRKKKKIAIINRPLGGN